MKVNVGCGDNPTTGWVNIDNSPTVLIAGTPLRVFLGWRSQFSHVVREAGVRYGNACNTRLPANSVSVLYASHVLEHFDRMDADRFLAEARRVLKPGGTLRICIPDLRMQVDDYLRTGDADAFLGHMQVAAPRPRRFREWLLALFRPSSRHNWMYDRGSLRKLLEKAGFVEIVDLDPGQTTIADPGDLNLSERRDESLYMEARRPAADGDPN